MVRKCTLILAISLTVIAGTFSYGGDNQSTYESVIVDMYAEYISGEVIIYSADMSTYISIDDLILIVSDFDFNQNSMYLFSVEVDDIDGSIFGIFDGPDPLYVAPPGYNEYYDSGDYGGWNEPND